MKHDDLMQLGALRALLKYPVLFLQCWKLPVVMLILLPTLSNAVIIK